MTATTPGSSSTLGYLPQLDGLRAVAVLLVVLYHVVRDEAGVLIPGAFLGVDVFFVLSGFLITSLLLAEHGRTGRIRLLSFYRRRFWRLYPGLVLVSVFAAAWFTLVPTPPNGELPDAGGDTPAGAFYALTYLASWAYAFGWPTGAMGHAWSLSVEEHFYVVWPVLCLLLLRRQGLRALRWTVALTLLASVWPVVLRVLSDPDRVRLYAAPDTRASQLLIGCVLAMLLARPQGLGRLRILTSAPAAGTAVTLLAVGLVVLNRHEAAYYTGGQQLVAVAAACVIAHLVTQQGSLTRLLSIAPAVALGRWSYGIYLWHVPKMIAPYALLGVSTGTRLLGSGVAVALAAMSFRYVEQPLLTRFGRRRTEPTGTSPAESNCVSVELPVRVGAGSPGL